jgi:predicted AAA+ superfamily ATPase
MKRIIDYYLRKWRTDSIRQPLILNGARQVGKTHAVRKLGAAYDSFVEINFEKQPEMKLVFDLDLDPIRITKDLAFHTNKAIIPGETLLFFDEIQEAPKVLLALRYFYEEMPELHVIAAGSLLEFTIQQVGVPVGRVEFLNMYPMAFIEFLAATGNHLIIEEILNHEPTKEFSSTIHEKCLRHIAEYLALGGMPAVIDSWQSSMQPRDCEKRQRRILESYQKDFNKYATEKQIPFVSLIFGEIPKQLGGKFKYSDIEGDYRKRELQPALDLLQTAGVIHKIYDCAGQGLPLGAQVSSTDFKTIFLDVGLAQSLLMLDLGAWFLYPQREFVDKGAIIESFVGQEFLAYSDPTRMSKLYYWQRHARSSSAEIDYLIQQKEHIIPVEVKGGPGTTLKSMHAFLSSHPQSPYGIRFSTQNYSVFENINSYPLYAVAKVACTGHEDIKKSIEALLI